MITEKFCLRSSMTKTKLFKKEYAKELLSVAKQDLEGAEILMNSSLKRQEITLFHLQQAIEKALKALLCWQEKPVPLVHSLAIILDKVDSADIPYEADLEELTQYATIRPYEEGVAVFTKDEIIHVFNVTKQVLKAVEKKIK